MNQVKALQQFHSGLTAINNCLLMNIAAME